MTLRMAAARSVAVWPGAGGGTAILAVAAIALGACDVAFARGSAATPDTGSKSPIDVTADQSEVYNARCLAILRGDAEAVQDGNRLRADTLTLHSRPKGADADGKTSCGGVDHIEADGHVYYVTPDQTVRGEHAVYDQDADQIVVTGDVVVVQGQNVARGDRLTLKVSTHEATLLSNVTGAGKPGRVRGVFYPDKTASTDKTAADSRAAKP
jgi:lipopolysaccharide export system protein LptA